MDFPFVFTRNPAFCSDNFGYSNHSKDEDSNQRGADWEKHVYANVATFPARKYTDNCSELVIFTTKNAVKLHVAAWLPAKKAQV